MAKPSHLKSAIQHTRPQPSAADLVECIQTNDFGTKQGKQGMWRLLAGLTPFHKAEVARLRDRYLEQRFIVGDANRLAMLDIAATLPTAHCLPDGLLDSMRPGAEFRDPPGGPGAYAARDKVQAARDVPRETPGEPKSGKLTTTTQFDQMVAQVKRCSKGKTGIGQTVAWVHDHLVFTLDQLDADDIPSTGALGMWRWARQNETNFRTTYHCKTIPSRGIAEDQDQGFIDTGVAIGDIIIRIKEGAHPGAVPAPGVTAGTVPAIGENDVSMRDLPAAKPDGDDNLPPGGVHGMPESTVAGREGRDSTAAGRPGGDPDGREGPDIREPGVEAGSGSVDIPLTVYPPDIPVIVRRRRPSASADS